MSDRVTSWYVDPATFENSRKKFYDALRVHGLRIGDAVKAADLFAQVVGRTLVELVPEEMDRMRDVVQVAAEMVKHPASREVLERLEDAVDAYDAARSA